MKRYLALISLIIAATSCDSQVEKKQSKNEILNLIYELCPTADVLDIEKKNDSYTEIEYLCNEKVVEIGVLDGKVVYEEIEAEKSDIPYAKIIHKIEKKYAGWLLDEINQVTTKDDTFLKVEIVKGGVEQNVFFTMEGKKYNTNSIVISDQWNIEMLATSEPFKQVDYRFFEPDAYYEMPDLLREVSGITFLDSTTILCVQDELGIVFSYNLRTAKTTNFHRFTDIGDFEDLTIADSTVHVLRSDGTIFSFDIDGNKKNKQTSLAVSSLNIEGFFYNTKDNYMYLASKEPEVFKNEKEALRPVYRYLNDGNFEVETYFDIDTKEINKMLAQNFPTLKNNAVQFNPSALAFQPTTQSVFVLSASDRILAIYNYNKQLTAIYPLPAKQYYKPEGLVFGKDGTLFISNEGDKTGLIKGNITQFNFKAN